MTHYNVSRSRYWPYSWSIFGEAWNDIVAYMTFNLPPLLPGEPMDAVQKLTYAGVVFLLAPFQIVTGAAQSPGDRGPVPLVRAAVGRTAMCAQSALLRLVAFLVFIAIHLSMIFFWSWGQLNASMIFGSVRNLNWATACSLAIIGAIVAIHHGGSKERTRRSGRGSRRGCQG